MHAFASDNVIGKSLRLYGEWAEHELSVLRTLIPEGSTVVDVGANIGTHTLPFSRWVGSGRVIAIEAQPAVSEVLRLNCLENGCHNVQVVNAISAERCGTFAFRGDYAGEQNVGAISFAPKRTGLWRRLSDWLGGFQGRAGSDIPVVTLDSLCANEPIAFIKLDIEGMELDAMRGARETLSRCHPAIYLEQNNAAHLAETYDYLAACSYRLFWLETHPFNQNNFRRAKENVWWRTETGIICVPNGVSPPSSLVEVQRDDPAPPSRLDARMGIAITA
jgi:FkbM family methyltransferase